MTAFELARAIDAIGKLAFPREATRQYVADMLDKRRKSEETKKPC